MASAIRLIPRLTRMPTVLQRCAAAITGRTLIIPSVMETQVSRTQSKLLAQKSQFLKPQTRMMSTDPDCEEEIRERVLHTLCCFDKINPDLLTLGSHFFRDLGLDSLDHVEIIVAIEDDFSFEIPDVKAEVLLTPQEIIEYLCEQFDIDE